jgi:putative toxin-antitoxin system antitoxin component (TIGR02293 family)
MAKVKKGKKYKQNEDRGMKASEERPLFAYQRKSSSIRDFTYSDFKKISAKVDFTQKEWSEILHISERTLQRYAHDNGNFNSGAVDRLSQIDKVIYRGKEVFGSYQKFNNWLRSEPFFMEGRLSLHSLSSIEGIHNVNTELGRIEHGIFS